MIEMLLIASGDLDRCVERDELAGPLGGAEHGDEPLELDRLLGVVVHGVLLLVVAPPGRCREVAESSSELLRRGPCLDFTES